MNGKETLVSSTIVSAPDEQETASDTVKRRKPQLTIVMITFNSEGVLEVCLRSVKAALEYSGIDYTLKTVDNGSQDNTLGIVESIFPQADTIANGQNLGYARAVNQALACVESDWILLLNPDTVLPTRLFEVLRQIKDCPDIRIFSPLLVDERSSIVKTSYNWPSLTKEAIRLLGLEPLIKRTFKRLQKPLDVRGTLPCDDKLGNALIVDYVAGAALFIRSELWRQVGPFDEHFFLYHEEMEWCYRASLKGFKTVVLTGYSVLHMGAKSVDHRPLEVPLWEYAGLIYFYSKYRSTLDQTILRTLTLLSFAVRAAFKFLGYQRKTAALYLRIALLCLRNTSSRGG